ncbi:hypothetical protein KM043_010396 [Ampulex compressa]|nr:hypothetical protein KM043_010396 [Ampulex compressa]
MADDPNRDILPVRDGSCVDTCRSNIDPRERHLVCKLDRYQLEDKYLRLLEEANSVKKLSNCQEDKIKRLTTKLMRLTANPRTCRAALDISDDRSKITTLELENTKLKDKICVLRNQLLSHTMTGRSSSRSRVPNIRPSSGRATCRSENTRGKLPSCRCNVEPKNDDSDAHDYLVKIEELEAEKKEMACRTAQLEKELSSYAINSQREKVMENVEYIKVWRQMKLLNDKLLATQDTNESLKAQINDLNRALEETTKNNQDITTALMTEKMRVVEIDEQMLKAKDSQLSLREKDEQIRDLMNEIKILQQHNNELIALSSKYGQVEVENAELKKKITEQIHDRCNLKTAFNTEQAHIAALQTTNGQLLEKLEELQKNIDTLTVQLLSFQSKKETRDFPIITQVPNKQTETESPSRQNRRGSYKSTGSQVEKCKKCCETFEKIVELEKAVNTAREGCKFTDRGAQTMQPAEPTPVSTKDQGTLVMSPQHEKPRSKNQSPKKQTPKKQQSVEQETKNTLTPEKMLKLLDQAQISTPLEVARIGQKDATNNQNYGTILDQRHRQVVSLEKLLFGDSNC